MKPDPTAPSPVPCTADALFPVLLVMSPERLERLLGEDPARAAPWVRAAAECGLAEAQVRYGRMLLDGCGVTRDAAAALAWFERAAETGDLEGLNMVGRCLENGWGAPASPCAAEVFYRRAAQAGHPWAQYNLAHLLLDGAGVARDAAEAFAWYRRAAEAGHARAMNLVARCYEHGWGVAVDRRAAGDWYARSAGAGCFRGAFNHASLLAEAGRTAEALVRFAAAAETAPPAARRLMGEALAAMADPRLAALGADILRCS
jgi:TPR repeat protein